MDVHYTISTPCFTEIKLLATSIIVAGLVVRRFSMAMLVVVAALVVAGQLPAAVAEKLPNAIPTNAGVTASYLRRWAKRIVEYPLNLGLPAYQSKRGPVTVNGGSVPSNGSAARSSNGGDTRFTSELPGSPDISHSAGYFKLSRTHDAQ